MSFEEVRRVDYEGELWDYPESLLRPELVELLQSVDVLLVLRHGSPPYSIVLGVPHQAAVGVARICKKRRTACGQLKGRESDENAASYALVAFTALRDRCVPCKLVIMAHATTHDPNKVRESPYCEEIFREETFLLFECHGSGPKRRNSLELTAGCNDLSDGLLIPFGRALARALGYRYSLGVQKKPCRASALVFRMGGGETGGEVELSARDTTSLVEAKNRWNIPALHLEAKPAFRKPTDGTNTVTPDGLLLGRAIACVIIEQFSETELLARSGVDPFIELPYGGPRAGFHVSQLIAHIRSTGRDYIIQGQQHCTADRHTKPQSLDMWLRREWAGRPDICQAVNEVVDALVATGLFVVVGRLVCPDSGRRVKGLRLVGGAGQESYSRVRS